MHDLHPHKVGSVGSVNPCGIGNAGTVSGSVMPFLYSFVTLVEAGLLLAPAHPINRIRRSTAEFCRH